jgi:membrane fusion protein, multidrug efflux system
MTNLHRAASRSLSTPAIASIALIAAAFGAGCSKESAPPPRPPPQVSVLTVAPRTIPFTPTFVAQTESSRQVNIVARVSGFLERIAYTEGEMVKQGQVMFQLDPKPLQAQLNSAKGELQSQQARLATAKANYARVKPLADEDALSQSELDKAKGELDGATAAVFAANAKVEEASLNLGYVTITAPVTGLASRALQRQGAYINAMSDSANLTYVAAADPIWVNFSISQNQMAKWTQAESKGQLLQPAGENYEVELVLPGGGKYPYKGKISFADPAFSPDTGSFMVRAVLPNPKLDLKPGMFVTAYVIGATRPNAIVVPQLAVQQGSNGHLVYVVNDKSVAEIRPVVVGDYQGEKDIVILTGLQAGDRVVVDGVMKVVPGQPVAIVAPGEAATAPSPPPAKK